MEVILGAGGGTADALREVLQKEGRPVRLVSRNPVATYPREEAFPADLLDPEAASAAVRGCSVAYLLVGLPYRTKLWEASWPKLINNVLEACAASGTALVFLDNVYLYAPSAVGMMTEVSVVAPRSRKGKVRAQVATSVLEAHASGKVRTLIARSADFYGPGISNGILQELLVKNIAAGKRGQWLADIDQPHNFTYVPDIGRALAQLGKDDSAYGQTWHLPTSSEALTATEWAGRFATALGQEYRKPMVLRPWMIRAGGIFQPDVAELYEMLYQYDRPYVFRSDAFTERYGWEATPVERAVREIVG